MTPWDLPEAVEIAGKRYAVNGDYRDVLEIIRWLQNEEEPEPVRLRVALALFYDEEIPREDRGEAIRWMMWFIAGGQEEKEGCPAPKLLDWEQDSRMIISDVNRVAGQEIRALPFLHWWTFLAWFGAVGQGQLSAVVAIRDKLRRGKKLEKWEQEFYREHREQVDFKKKYTQEEQEEQERIKRVLGE